MSNHFQKHGFQFQLAQAEHDFVIAKLLNENAIPGWIELSYKTTPRFHLSLHKNIFSSSVIGIHQTTNKIGGIATRSVHPSFLASKEANIGWLGQLRIDPEFRNRAHLLKSGFDAVKTFLHDRDKTPYYLASIIAENKIARRILEANLDGFPIFEPILNYHVKAFSTQQVWGNFSKHIRVGSTSDMPRIIEFINSINKEFDFTPRLISKKGKDEISAGKFLGLSAEDFLIHLEDEQILGVVALWDQQKYRQLQVQGYSKLTPWVRSLINIFSPLTRLPKLPGIGENLRQIFISFPAIKNNNKEVFKELYSAALKTSKQRGAQLCLAGFTEHEIENADSLKLKHYAYDSLIYRVYWPEDAYLVNKSLSLQTKIEIALL